MVCVVLGKGSVYCAWLVRFVLCACAVRCDAYSAVRGLAVMCMSTVRGCDVHVRCVYGVVRGVRGVYCG